MKHYKDLAILRASVLATAGILDADVGACERISVMIFLRNGDYISKSTLLRFFELVPDQKGKSSVVVLEMLERFANGSLD